MHRQSHSCLSGFLEDGALSCISSAHCTKIAAHIPESVLAVILALLDIDQEMCVCVCLC